MKKYIRMLIIAGVVVLVGLAVWRGTSNTPLATAPAQSLLPSASPTPIDMVYDPAPKEWKSYSSASLGFSISYPADWRVDACGTACVGWTPPTVPSGQFALGIIRSTGTLDGIVEKAGAFLIAKEEIVVGGLTWLKLTLRQPQTNALVTSHFIERGGQLFEFGTATSEPDIISAYGRMIASLKFLK